MARRPYTPERAYRVSVVPLSIFFVIAGLVFFVVSLVVDGKYIFMPPLGPKTASVAFGGIGLFLAAVGVGLLFRLKTAWYAMLAYFILGAPWAAWSWATAPEEMAPPVAFVVFGTLLNVGIAVGLYFVTRPVFVRAREESQADKAG
ncbi:MAG: hypothetical protein ACYTFI_17450 [Planctomycetota bacterium]|jgi:hypothetical protein